MAMTLKVLRGQRNSRPKFQKKFNKVSNFIFQNCFRKKLKYISCFLLHDMYLCICKNWEKILNFFYGRCPLYATLHSPGNKLQNLV